MNVNLEYYKVFYTVAKTGSFSGAAARLLISQPAVSQGIKHLEEALHANLFLRTSKGVRLTPEGERLFSYVSAGYEYFIAAEESFRELQNLERGEIRIGASDMTLRFFLLPYLEEFHSLYPKVKISVTNGPTPETLRFLQEGAIDFALITGPVEAPSSTTLQPIAQVQDCFVAAPKYRHLLEHPLTAGELAQLPLIMLEPGSSTRRGVDAWFAAQNAQAKPEFELATSDLIVHFATRGMGIGCVVQDFATQALAGGELLLLPLAWPIPPRQVLLATPQKPNPEPACKKLLEMILR